MAKTQEGPFFNLKAVVQKTGLKPDTLRAWERRYGVPAPKRSGGGHRLYSRRDIKIVMWLMARQQEGLSIKRAVELWADDEAEGQDPLQSAPSVLTPSVIGETLSQLRDEWIGACLAYDEQRAEQILVEGFALYPPETVCLELLRPAIADIGDRWYRGEVTVQQEHFASALAIRRLLTLIAAVPPPTRPGRILAACPPQEQHVLGLLLLTYLIRRRGWDVVYLGADVPVERLEATVAATRPRLVILAAQQLHSAATLVEAAELLREQGAPTAYGGLVFDRIPALRARVPGHFLGQGLESALQMAEALLVTPRPLPPTAAVPEAYLQARDHYQERQGLVEARIREFLPVAADGLHRQESGAPAVPSPDSLKATGGGGIAPAHLALANRELALHITAALSLGDMGFVGTDITWLLGLLSHHLPGGYRQEPQDSLRAYLKAYHESARMNLDERGQPILDWLAELN